MEFIEQENGNLEQDCEKAMDGNLHSSSYFREDVGTTRGRNSIKW